MHLCVPLLGEAADGCGGVVEAGAFGVDRAVELHDARSWDGTGPDGVGNSSHGGAPGDAHDRAGVHEGIDEGGCLLGRGVQAFALIHRGGDGDDGGTDAEAVAEPDLQSLHALLARRSQRDGDEAVGTGVAQQAGDRRAGLAGAVGDRLHGDAVLVIH